MHVYSVMDQIRTDNHSTLPFAAPSPHAPRSAGRLVAMALFGASLALTGCHAEADIGRSNRTATSGGEDHDRGHGNDADGDDSDNPGRGRGR